MNRQDLDAYWMPFTGNRYFKDHPIMVTGSEGNYYVGENNNRIFDGLSGLWCVGLGHCRPEITAAVSAQMGKLDYAPAFQVGHSLAFDLANKLVSLTPDGLDRAFFTNSGSESVETALKMARAYWRQKG